MIRHQLQRDCRRRRNGFTLIEVLLSLGLAALVLVALATAVDVHLRCVQTGRTHVEEAQLARALLHRIGDDLRNAAGTAECSPTELLRLALLAECAADFEDPPRTTRSVPRSSPGGPVSPRREGLPTAGRGRRDWDR